MKYKKNENWKNRKKHLKWASNFIVKDTRIIVKLYDKGLIKIDCLDFNDDDYYKGYQITELGYKILKENNMN